MIGQVTDTNAPETRSALQVGDTLLAVEGHDACRRWHHEIQADLAGKVGDKRRLRVRRSGSTIDLEVPVVDLFALRP